MWQVSANAMRGPLRATSTNAVVTDGFDERVFHSLAYKRPVYLTARARKHCNEKVVLDAPQFDRDCPRFC